MKCRGFTMIELLVVIAIIVHPGSNHLPCLRLRHRRRRRGKRRPLSDMRQIGMTINVLQLDHDQRPPVKRTNSSTPDHDASGGIEGPDYGSYTRDRPSPIPAHAGRTTGFRRRLFFMPTDPPIRPTVPEHPV